MIKKSGFTIIELMVVLLIAGVLVGGIVIGKSLIDTARLTRTVSELAQYNDWAHQFKSKYGYWPGDLPNATNYWVGQVGGDGNGSICGNSSTLCTSTSSENMYAMRMLAAAGFAPGTYTGTVSSGSNYIVPGSNVPRSSMSGATGNALGSLVYVYMYNTTLNKNVIALSDWANSPTYSMSNGVTAADSYAIDRKRDDGKPGSGKLIGQNHNATCITGSSYDTVTSGRKCLILDVVGY